MSEDTQAKVGMALFVGFLVAMFLMPPTVALALWVASMFLAVHGRGWWLRARKTVLEPPPQEYALKRFWRLVGVVAATVGAMTVIGVLPWVIFAWSFPAGVVYSLLLMGAFWFWGRLT
jgi:hypothetical protein